MHNMLAIAVDFGRLLHIGSEVATGELVDMEYRMRYIGGEKAREKYAQQMKERLELLGVSAMLEEAAKRETLREFEARSGTGWQAGAGCSRPRHDRPSS